jgi:hypothetical protein
LTQGKLRFSTKVPLTVNCDRVSATDAQDVRIEPLQIGFSEQKGSAAIAEPTPGNKGLLQTYFDVTQEASI